MSEAGRAKISAVVVTYNSARDVGACLKGLRGALGAGAEIVVIDNASADDTLEAVAKSGTGAKVVRLEKNVGFAGGVNKGFENSRGDYVLVVNPDVLVGAECVEKLAGFLAGRDKAGAAGPRLVDSTGEEVPSRRRYPTVRGILTNRFGFLRLVLGSGARRRYLMLDEPMNGTTEVDWLSGGCLMIKRRALQDVGGFDEGFFLYFEDTDWCWRAKQKGWGVYYLPECGAVHDCQRESARGLNLRFAQHVRSMMRFYRKHGVRI